MIVTSGGGGEGSILIGVVASGGRSTGAPGAGRAITGGLSGGSGCLAFFRKDQQPVKIAETRTRNSAAAILMTPSFPRSMAA